MPHPAMLLSIYLHRFQDINPHLVISYIPSSIDPTKAQNGHLSHSVIKVNGDSDSILGLPFPRDHQIPTHSFYRLAQPFAYVLTGSLVAEVPLLSLL